MNLNRFIQAQERDYPIALQEMKNGQKQSHWIWYIFPQIAGLGHSSMCRTYGIKDAEEALAYYKHSVLGQRLIEICRVLLENPCNDPVTVMNWSVDAKKLRSSMTLFAEVAKDQPIFQAVLDKYFDGRKCEWTMQKLGIKFQRKGAF